MSEIHKTIVKKVPLKKKVTLVTFESPTAWWRIISKFAQVNFGDQSVHNILQAKYLFLQVRLEGWITLVM